MKDYIYKNKVRAMLLLATMMMAACSGDDDNVTTDDDSDTLQLVAYIQLQTDDETFATRALTEGDLGNYQEYKGPNAIGVFLTYETETAPEKVSTFTWEQINETTGNWESQVKVKIKGNPYRIYGFMPTAFGNAPGFTYTIAPVSSNYSNGARLTFSNLPAIAAEDFCLLTGVQDLEGNESTALDLKQGVFSYQGRGKGENFVNLMFDHLYAGIQFKMTVGTTYSQLRTIKLKEMKLKTSMGLSSVNWEATVTPNGNETRPYTISSTATFQQSDSEVTLFTSDEGETLTTSEPLLISGYVFPFPSSSDYIGNHLSIACKYDVYDRKGNLIRKDCTAENQLPAPPDGQWGMGKRIVVPLTVEPTYLYVLSEPDLDNPTIIIN